MGDTVTHLVVLRVLVDDGRPWWQAMGLPDPVRWESAEAFGDAVLVRSVLEEKIVRSRSGASQSEMS